MSQNFTIKKIYTNLKKVSNLNLAVILENGELYIHENGQMMLESVYNSNIELCDVTSYVVDYNNNEYTKKDTARMICESAKIFYEK